MVSQLTNTDYVSILKYYNLNIPRSKKLIKTNAEKIMAEKLCRCIKKVDKNNESKSIPICNKNIFINKGLKLQRFKCKKTQSVKFVKTNKNNKTNKNKKLAKTRN